MSINSVTAMDVDSPSGSSALKRSSSAPMINEINANMTTSQNNSVQRENNSFNVFSGAQPRIRRFSASFTQVPGSPVSGPRLAPRINQIRQEECVEREVLHERDIHSQMQMSQSCEDLTLMNDALSLSRDSDLKSRDTDVKMGKDCKMMPLHLNLGACQSGCSSPSPTRHGFTAFSPAGVQIWKTLSPSPSRKHTFLTRRSLSPIAMRQSPLGGAASVKRKLDDDKLDFSASPRAKRLNSASGLLMAHSHSMSPLQGQSLAGHSLAGSLSSVGTPESIGSVDSPGFGFRPVDSPSPREAQMENSSGKTEQGLSPLQQNSG